MHYSEDDDLFRIYLIQDCVGEPSKYAPPYFCLYFWSGLRMGFNSFYHPLNFRQKLIELLQIPDQQISKKASLPDILDTVVQPPQAK